MEQLLEHSPLGASGMERWLACPGSVAASRGHDDPESEHAALGTAAHFIASCCLSYETQDAWEYVGEDILNGDLIPAGPSYEDFTEEEQKRIIPVDKNMADAVQMYLDVVRIWHPDRNQGNSWIERKFHCPNIHPAFYGTSDFIYLDEKNSTLHVWDYKHGAGIVVEAKNNVQLLYYAVGAVDTLQLWDKVELIVLHISQPRGYHWQGPLRSWAISIKDLQAWMFDILIPAMDMAEKATLANVTSGEHCRFCPARHGACPALMKDVDELEKLMTKVANSGGVKKLKNGEIGRILVLCDIAKIISKAVNTVAFNRLQAGVKIPGRKLVNSRTNREWKEGAEVVLKKKFGKKAYDTKLLSPAQVEGLPEGKDLAIEWAFKPDGGQTVAADSDNRVGLNKDTKSLFDNVKGAI